MGEREDIYFRLREIETMLGENLEDQDRTALENEKAELNNQLAALPEEPEE